MTYIPLAKHIKLLTKLVSSAEVKHSIIKRSLGRY